MNDKANITIGLLTISACILGTILILGTAQPAQGVAAMSRGGDYIATSGQVTSRRDVIYVIDTAAHQLNGYTINIQDRSINLQRKHMIDLDRALARPDQR